MSERVHKADCLLVDTEPLHDGWCPVAGDNVIEGSALQVLSLAERNYVDAVGELAAAEIEEAETFLARKHEYAGEHGKVRSDWEARAMACIDTNARVTQARGAVEIAANRMRRETDLAVESD